LDHRKCHSDQNHELPFETMLNLFEFYQKVIDDL
jgi:hypothetical protein